MKKTLIFFILFLALLHSFSATATKYTIFIYNEDMDSNKSSFWMPNEKRKKILEKPGLPLVPTNYNGKKRAYFSIPEEAKGKDYEQYFEWFSARSTKFVVGLEDKEGTGFSETFSFPWKSGFHALTLDLPEKAEMNRINVALRSVLQLYPGKISTSVYRNLATISLLSNSLHYDKANDAYYTILKLTYRKPFEARQIGNILSLEAVRTGLLDNDLKEALQKNDVSRQEKSYPIPLLTQLTSSPASAEKVKIFVYNENVDPEDASFRNHIQLKNGPYLRFLKKTDEKISRRKFFQFFSIPSTEFIVSMEGEDGTGFSKTYSFPWKRGFHALIFNLPDGIVEQPIHHFSVTLRSVLQRSADDDSPGVSRNLATAFFSYRSLDSHKNIGMHKTLRLRYTAWPLEPREIGNIISFIPVLDGSLKESLERALQRQDLSWEEK